MGHLVREHEHRSGPGSSVDLAGLGALFLLGAHVVAASACQHGAGRTDDLVDGRVRIRVTEHPAHGVAGARDQAVQRHRHVPEDCAHRTSIRLPTAASLEADILRWRVRAVLFSSGRFAQLSSFREWVKAHFHEVVDLPDEGKLYVNAHPP